MKNTLLFSLVAFIVQVAAAYMVEQYISSSPYLLIIVATSLFFSLFTVLGMRFLFKSLKGRPQAFVYTFMGYSGAKMFSSAALILIVGLSFRPMIKELALGILLQYFIYLAYEIVHLRSALLNSEKN